MSNDFLYTIEKYNSLPQFIVHRSAKWRMLRDALSEMKVGEWLKVNVPEGILDPSLRNRFCENVRSGGVYSYYSAIGGSKSPFLFPTRIERDEDGTALAMWVGKIPKPA